MGCCGQTYDSLNLLEVFGEVGGFTPLALDDDLLLFVDMSDSDYVLTHPSFGGYIPYGKSQWAVHPPPTRSLINPSTYTDGTLIYDSANEEFTDFSCQATFFNRSTGEWWFTVDHVTNQDQGLFIMTDESSDSIVWAVLIVSNKMRYSTGDGSFTVSNTTTDLPAGKNIIRLASDGASLTYELNGVDLTSELTNNDGRWEDVDEWDQCHIARKAAVTPIYYDTRMKAMIRTKPLDADQSTNVYNYLTANNN